ncbi:metalloregulator ArsR/SmtB family transcription factor [Maricurvus nonylphenolicus]|uniref:ArsR/SmtB family transcription factor n=1 Tax=Maricurvus nonylphenolicus TaxID=1008307 RepID=UPI0036F32819
MSTDESSPAVTAADLQALAANAEQAANLMKQLSNRNRLMILCTLMFDELSVGQLNELIPLSQSALSQHLASLREAQLVATRREGQTIYYRLLGDEVGRVIRVLKDIYCPD